MPADYYNLSATTAEMVVSYKARFGEPTDEMLLEAAERIHPRLMPRLMMGLLRTELDPASQRRGRPRRGVTRARLLSHRLEKLGRTDVAPGFLALLIGRLTAGKGLCEVTRAQRAYRSIRKSQRDSLIRGLYRQFQGLLGDATEGHVVHPVLGPVPILPASTPSERARLMTGTTIRKLEGHSPSEPTIGNLVSGKNRGHFRERKRA